MRFCNLAIHDPHPAVSFFEILRPPTRPSIHRRQHQLVGSLKGQKHFVPLPPATLLTSSSTIRCRSLAQVCPLTASTSGTQRIHFPEIATHAYRPETRSVHPPNSASNSGPSGIRTARHCRSPPLAVNKTAATQFLRSRQDRPYSREILAGLDLASASAGAAR